MNWILRSIPFVVAFYLMVWCGYLSDKYPEISDKILKKIDDTTARIEKSVFDFFFED